MKLTRREFTFSLSAGALAAQTPVPRVAITMDDFNWKQIPGVDPEEANRGILDALARHKLRAFLFVCGRNLQSAKGRQLLRAWSEAGHRIGNHTYSHPSCNAVSPPTFIQDLQHGEAMLGGFATFEKMFRFPYLKEGDTARKRDQIRAYLQTHGYRTGHVTIDTSDWYYDQRLRGRLDKDPAFDTRRYREPYLEHMLHRATYYDSLARDVLGATISHTLLVHYNLINVLFLDDLLTMFETKGWQLISAQAAYQDPVFSRRPGIVPAGESLIWALAKESGRFEARLRYPAESDEYEKAKLDRLGL